MALITIQKDNFGYQIETYINSDGRPIIKINDEEETVVYVFSDHNDINYFIERLKEVKVEYELNNPF